MNDEIREILDKAKEISKYGADGKQHTRFFNQFEAKSLLDYIINLQQEKEDYKSRCEKAIEYIENNTHYYSTSKHGEGFVIDNENEEEFCNDLLNILQNGSEK